MVERAVIDGLEIFSRLAEVERGAVALAAVRRVYTKGDVLFHAGDPRDRFFVIVEGDVRISSSFYGREQTIVVYHAQAFIGLHVIVAEPSARRSTAEVVSSTAVIVETTRSEWAALLKEYPTMLGNLLRSAVTTLDERLVYANRKLFTLYTVSRMLRTARSIEQAAREILPVALSVAAAERGLFVMRDTITGAFVPTAMVGYAQTGPIEAWAGRFERDTCVGAVTSSKESHIITEAPAVSAPPYATGSMLITPLLVGGTAVGAIVLADRAGGRPFAHNTRMVVETIAQQLADAIERGRLTSEQEAHRKLRRVYIAPYNEQGF